MIEYRFVPLLMCSSRTADDMSISAMTRGIAVGQVRSSISRPRLSLLDFQTAKLSGDMTYDGKSLLDRDIFTLSGGEKTAFAFVHG